MPVVHKRSKSFLKSKIILVIAVILLVFFTIGLVREILNRREINNQVNSLENQITDLQSQNGQISNLIGTWQDGSHLEKEARLRLGLQKPGEKTIIISQSESKISSSEPAINSDNTTEELPGMTTAPVPNPVKWIHHFFK